MSRYYMPKANDGAIGMICRYLLHRERPRPAFPSAIQIQTTSLCNASCIFCGWKNTRKSLPQGQMEESLFRKIADECGRNFVTRISPYLMNEPLIDKDLPRRIAYLSKRVKPWTKIKLSTNGALLTPEVSERLIDAGLRRLWVSVQGYSQETYGQSMSLDLKSVLNNIDVFLEMKKRRKAKLPKLLITTLRTKIVEHELEEAARYWAMRGVEWRLHNPDNRSGEDISNLSTQKIEFRRRCDLFLKQAYILYNGDMILCCHDWGRTVVLGNVAESSIKEIWNSKKYLDLIREYQAGDFSNLAICRNCRG